MPNVFKYKRFTIKGFSKISYLKADIYIVISFNIFTGLLVLMNLMNLMNSIEIMLKFLHILLFTIKSASSFSQKDNY